jgi:hypothetical protein
MFLSEWSKLPSATCFALKNLHDSLRLDVDEIVRIA